MDLADSVYAIQRVVVSIGVPCWPTPAHAGEPTDALVIGLGTGITTATLARHSELVVDTYDINHTLKDMLREFPDGTLRVAENPRVNLIWQDGRSGLALRDQSYDLITQQPLYLKQAGSSILLSREYMQLVRSRLRPGGIYCVYSNSLGNKSQALLVLRTLREVFPYVESLNEGYALLGSNEPIQFTRDDFEARLAKETPFHDEVRRVESALQQRGHSLYDQLDRPRLDWSPGKYSITDNHPLVEYPQVIDRLSSRPDF